MKILIVDDEEIVLKQAKAFLEKERDELSVECKSSSEEALDRLEGEDFDAIVSDYKMPGMDGLELLQTIRKRGDETPFIMFTGKGREEIAMETLNNGGDRYVQKRGKASIQYKILYNAIEQVIARKKAEDREKEALEEKNKIMESVPDILYFLDHDLKLIEWNRELEERTGFTAAELEGRYMLDFFPDEDRDILKEIMDRVSEEKMCPAEGIEADLLTKEGKTIPYSWSCNIIKDEQGGFSGVVGSGRNISERKRTEEKYKAIVEQSHDAIFIYRGKNFLFINNRLSDVTGYSKEELHQMDPWKLIHSDDRERVRKLVEKRRAKEDDTSIYEAQIMRKEGDSRVGEFIVSDIEYEGERAALGVVRDITERKEMEKELRKSKQEVADSKSKLKHLYTITRKMASAPSKEQVYELIVDCAEDILELDICKIMIPKGNEMVVEAISKKSNIEDGASIPIRDSIAGKSYRKNEVFLIDELDECKEASPFKDDFHSGMSIPIADSAVFQAVSERKKQYSQEDMELAELLISHAEEAIKRIESEQRSEFLLTLLRHDLKNKSQIVRGYLQLMSESDPPSEFKPMIEKALNANIEGNELLEKVGTLRDIDREEEITSVNVLSHIKEAVKNRREMAEEKGIDIEYEDLPVMIKGGALLEELFSNLLNNSIQHSEGDEIRIGITENEEQDEVIVSVEDNGKGISEEVKDEIFDRGTKGSDSSGLGIGLFLVKRIAKSYNGRVEATDSSMGGARFDIILKKAS